MNIFNIDLIRDNIFSYLRKPNKRRNIYDIICEKLQCYYFITYYGHGIYSNHDFE